MRETYSYMPHVEPTSENASSVAFFLHLQGLFCLCFVGCILVHKLVGLCVLAYVAVLARESNARHPTYIQTYLDT